MTKFIIKINLRGGIISSGNFMSILGIAEKAGVNFVRFGNRQELYFRIIHEHLYAVKKALTESKIPFEVQSKSSPNILSSYVTEAVFHNTNWLREDVYRDVLDNFDYEPRLKINLVGNTQSFVPYFNGNLNFITSELSNYWFLHIRFPKTNISYTWPVLIYSLDIPAISKLIEEQILANKDLFYEQTQVRGNLLYTMVNAKKSFITEPITEDLKFPVFQLPYYEGFNRYGNKLWLGIYRRNEKFPVEFLKDIASICLSTRIGQIYTTPWKSLIIKGILLENKKLWDDVLAKHRINVRHAANELNWQVEDLCEEGLNLKHELVRSFDAVDLRTYPLCFAIKTQPKTGLFGSIIIKKGFREREDKAKEKFDLLYTKDFNPNSKEFVTYKTQIERTELFQNLTSLCDIYYKSLLKNSTDTAANISENARDIPEDSVFQCGHCLTVYDEEAGEQTKDIPPVTAFEDLDDSFTCPTCEAPKQDFVKINMVQLFESSSENPL